MSDATSRPHIRIRPAGADGLDRWGELWEFRDVLVMLAVQDFLIRCKHLHP